MRRPRFNVKRMAVLFDPLKKMLGDLDIDIALTTAVVSHGPASAYALVWEYGNIRQTKKGPKTTLGVDPETGARVWLTIQAPQGYVRILKPRFRRVIDGELATVKWGRKDTPHQLEQAVNRIGEEMTRLVKDRVPVDKMDLQSSITFIPATKVSSFMKSFGEARGMK